MNTSLLKDVTIKWGAILGGASILFFYIVAITDQYSNMWLGLVSIAILIAVLVFATKAYRDGNEGLMSYGEGVGVGVLVSVLGGILMAVFVYLYTQYADLDYLANVQEAVRDSMGNWGLDEDKIEEMMEQQANRYTPGAFALQAILNSGIAGLIISLITAAIMKRSPKHDGHGLH